MSDRWMKAEEDAMEIGALMQAVEYFYLAADRKTVEDNLEKLKTAHKWLDRLIAFHEMAKAS